MCWDGHETHVLCNYVSCKQHAFFDFPVPKTRISSVINYTKTSTVRIALSVLYFYFCEIQQNNGLKLKKVCRLVTSTEHISVLGTCITKKCQQPKSNRSTFPSILQLNSLSSYPFISNLRYHRYQTWLPHKWPNHLPAHHRS